MSIIKEIAEEHFKDIKYLHLNCICHKCKLTPIDCQCDDKWIRLNTYYLNLIIAETLDCLQFILSPSQKIALQNNVEKYR